MTLPTGDVAEEVYENGELVMSTKRAGAFNETAPTAAAAAVTSPSAPARRGSVERASAPPQPIPDLTDVSE